MNKTSVRLSVIVAPMIIVGALQLTGCARREIAPPNPGGIYRSTSGGAQFDQSVPLVDEAGTLTGYLDSVNFRLLYRSPNDPNRVYALAGGQGVFVSENNGETWQVLPQPLAAVTGFIELESGIMLVSGTTAQNSGAVVRTLDRAKSWEPVLHIPRTRDEPSKFYEVIKTPPSPPVFVSSLAADPFQPDQLYAATTTGEILVGSESGKVWRAIQRLTGTRDPLTQRATSPISQLVPSPHVLGELLVVTTSGGLLRITADGREMINISNIRAVRFIEGRPNSLFVAGARGAAISADRGETWSELPLPLSQQVKLTNIAVAVSPTNPRRLLVAADSILYRSEDGGATWNSLTLNLPQHVITDISINPANAAQVLIATAPIPS